MQFRLSPAALVVVIWSFFSAYAAGYAQSWPGVTRPIHDVHIDRFAIWLTLSPEQEFAVRRLCEDYRTSWSEVLPDLRSEIGGLFREFRQESREPVNFNQEEIMAKLHRRTREVRAAMEHHDAEFFASISRLLTDEQLESMPRITRWRTRAILTASIRNSAPPEAGRVDLMELLRIDSDRQRRQFSAGEPEYVTLTRREYESLKEVMEEYELSLIASLDAAVRGDRNVASKHYESLDIYHALQRAGHTRNTHPEAYAEADRLNGDADRRRWGHAKSIRRINRSGLAVFCSLLPDTKAKELTRIYLEIAYSEIYPDPQSAETIYAVALEIQDIDGAQREGLIALRDAYRRRHALLSREMANSDDAYYKSTYEFGETFYEEKMKARMDRNVLGRHREQLNMQQYELLALILLPEQYASIAQTQGTGASTFKRPWYDERAGFEERTPPTLREELLRFSETERKKYRMILVNALETHEHSEEDRAQIMNIIETLDSILDAP